VPVIINELEVIVEEQTDEGTATRNAAAPHQAQGFRAVDVVRIVDREAERRARLRAD
jgi:hypothetical protein